MTPTAEKRLLSENMLNSLARLQTNRARTRFLSARRSLLRQGIARNLQEAAHSSMRVNSQRALAFASASLWIANELREMELIAHGKRIKANVLCFLGKYKQAILLYRQALALFRRRSDDEGIARTLSASIQPMMLLGQYEKAHAAAGEARQLLLKAGDTHRLAMLENNIGNLYHRQDRFEEALNHYQRAYELLIPFRDSGNLLVSFNNMAMCLISLNDFIRAMNIYEQAQELGRREDLPLLRTITDYNIAYLYFLRGQYQRAIKLLKAAQESGKSINDPYLLALCHLDLSDIYIELNLSEEAVSMASKAFEYFQELGFKYEAAKARANQAIALGQSGRSAQSIELFNESRLKFIEEGNQLWPNLIDLYQAILMAKEGNYTDARALCHRAAHFFYSSAIPTKRMLCHLLLGRWSLYLRDLNSAQKECEKALIIGETVETPMMRYQTFLLLGEIHQDQGKQKAAYAAFQKARTELEMLRAGLDHDELRIAFMKDKSTVYEFLVKICLTNRSDTNAKREAFTYMELAKSRCLTEGLQGRRELLKKDERIALQYKSLSEELSWFRHRIELEQLRSQEKSHKQINILTREAEIRERSLRQMICQLSSDKREISSPKATTALTLEEIQEHLRQDVTLIEYFSAGDEVLAAVVERDAFSIETVTSLSQVTALLRSLRLQIEKVGWNSDAGRKSRRIDLEATRSHLRNLYQQLLGKIRNKIHGHHLLVVPHGALHRIPFHALIDKESYLIDSFHVSYAPSASSFVLCEKRLSTTASNDLILGIPDDRAPYIADEAEAIHGLLPGSRLLTGNQATLSELKEAGPQSRFLHIATHGHFRPDNPAFSSIRLGDRFLHLYELCELDLPVELLVLSGCSTGLSVISGGDEQLGLVRGAFLAGVRSALLSLWNVNDRSTLGFMKSFYQRLKGHRSKIAAFHDALLELRDQYPHPYYWAPFFLTGAVFGTT